MTIPHWTTLVAPETLAGHLENPDVRVVDCRFELGKPQAGRETWLAAHLPGAQFADLELELSGPVTARSSRHPLPDVDTLSAVFSRLGIDACVQVVVYDAHNGAMAARLWWLLRWLGHERVALLDGGVKAWRAAGLPVTAELAAVQPRSFIARPDMNMVCTAQQVHANLQTGIHTLVDARAPERYAGLVEPLDPVAGHIPGARNHCFVRNLDIDDRFLPASTLHDQWCALVRDNDASSLVCYCGSGVTACHNLLALEIAGFSGARLYAGSWSEWCKIPDYPVRTGDAP